VEEVGESGGDVEGSGLGKKAREGGGGIDSLKVGEVEVVGVMKFDESGVGEGLLPIADVELVGVEREAGRRVHAHEASDHVVGRRGPDDVVFSEAVTAFGDPPAGFLEGGTEGCAGEDLFMHGSDGEIGSVVDCELDERDGAGGGDALVGAVEIGNAEGIGLPEEIEGIGSIPLFDAFAIEQRGFLSELGWRRRVGLGRVGRDHRALGQEQDEDGEKIGKRFQKGA
jgi:hypothetical protein